MTGKKKKTKGRKKPNQQTQSKISGLDTTSKRKTRSNLGGRRKKNDILTIDDSSSSDEGVDSSASEVSVFVLLLIHWFINTNTYL